MEEKIQGKTVWKFGDNFNADLIVGSKYIAESNAEVLGEVCLRDFDPEFAKRVQPGDVMIAGKNFGYGHPHQQGIVSLKKVGVAALVAESFYPLWYRMAIFYAFPIVICPGITQNVNPDDLLEIEFSTGNIVNVTTRQKMKAEPVPTFLMEVLQSGGLIKHLQKK
ncbi:MAG: 3-isopropylmalate dehydratase [Desulfobacteraceae bacterium]|nr:3-isopropylmalate dehydratase [Desulfobacteraceae bacterium]MBU4011824.1 3-isopropylmalate dehydratase [Pseudomonadota bacterium]MBU4055317.1 3-isopropylmalate dehydratase [Pseudomonadota bacterium]